MATIKKTPLNKADLVPIEVEESITLAEFEEMRAEIKKLRDKLNEAPAHIPATPEVDKFAEKNFEEIALRTKADIAACDKVRIVLPSDPLNPYDDILYIQLNGMTFGFKKGEEIEMPIPLYEIWKNSYDQTKRAESRVKMPDISKDEPSAVLSR